MSKQSSSKAEENQPIDFEDIERGTINIEGTQVTYNNREIDLGISRETLESADSGTIIVNGTEITFDNSSESQKLVLK